MDIINEILSKTAENAEKIKEITVHKDIELDIDAGTLLASDYNVFDNKTFSSNPEKYIKDVTRDNVQLLINKIWELPTTRVEEAIVAKLPTPSFILPRARRVPKPKPLTKWQEFAKKKGITKQKKGTSKLKWDDVLQKWIPGYGFKREEAEKQKTGIVELGDDGKAKEDPFLAKTAAKKERQAKNELQRLRNIAKAKNVKIPRVGIPSAEHFKSSRQLSTAVTVARVSTASVGKFQDRLPKEKDAKDIASHVPGLKKKRPAPPKNALEEKQRNVDVINGILKSNKKVFKGDIDTPSTSALREPSAKRKKGAPKSKGAKKPKAGAGKRDLHTKVGGRKRR